MIGEACRSRLVYCLIRKEPSIGVPGEKRKFCCISHFSMAISHFPMEITQLPCYNRYATRLLQSFRGSKDVGHAIPKVFSPLFGVRCAYLKIQQCKNEFIRKNQDARVRKYSLI